MVALRSSSSARSTAARACATLASASATLACATTSWLLAAALAVLGQLEGALRDRRVPPAASELLGVQRLGALVVAPRRTRRPAPRPRRCSSGAAPRRPRSAGVGGLEVGPRLAQPARQVLLVELDQDVAGLDDVADVDAQALDDPVGLRLDFDLGDRLDSCRWPRPTGSSCRARRWQSRSGRSRRRRWRSQRADRRRPSGRQR